MTIAYEIIATIQKLPNPHPNMRFLISLANHAFLNGGLTDKQVAAYNSLVDRLEPATSND